MAEETTNKSRRTERIGKYEILGHIATGGMGIVYKARDVDLDRLVALKILPAEFAKQEITLMRFHREAKAAAQLRHENIVAIFDVGESNGTHYIAMEFVEGTDLQDHIGKKCRLDPEEARQIMIQATKALAHAHEHGIVHRDIKPSNFLLTHKDKRLIVKLTDFGLAIRHENDAEFRLTRDKTTVGTVDYMSPEQARDSRAADIRSDIYSLGCTFFHMLAGLAPFAKGTLPERIVQHMQTPPDMRKLHKSVPEHLVAVITRMLAKDPADRHQSPTELLAHLDDPRKAPTGKRGSEAVGKLTRSGQARNPAERTQVMPTHSPDEEAEGPSQVKASRAKKGSPEPVEAKARENRRESERSSEPEVTGERDAAVLPRSKKRHVKNSRPWMYPLAGSTGVLLLVGIAWLVFGGNPESPNKDKPIERPPIVEAPEKKVDKTVSDVIDTSPLKMTVTPLVLPIMDTPRDKTDIAALRKEYYGPFTSFPAASEGTAVVRMSRLAAAGPGTARTLTEAFAQAKPNECTIIEIHDNGPLFVPALPALAKTIIQMRGAHGFRPLVVWEIPKKSGRAFGTFSQGKLLVENMDFVMRWSDDAPATLFELAGSDFYALDCTFSSLGKAPRGIAIVRHVSSKEAPSNGRLPQTWFKRCYVRGNDLTLLSLQEASAALMVEESLVVGHQQPLLQMHVNDDDTLALHCVRSTLVTGSKLLHAQAVRGNAGSPQVQAKVLDSILSRDDMSAVPGDLIHLADGADPGKVIWRATNSVYAGWRQLLGAGTKSIGGADIESWRRQFFYSAGDRAVNESWPSGPPSGLEEQPANLFAPEQWPTPKPVVFAAVSGEGPIGSVIGRLPAPPGAWVERAFEWASAPAIPEASTAVPRIEKSEDGLYHGERLDLSKVDLGTHLTGALQRTTPAARVVLHLAGKGTCQTSPVRVKGVKHLVLYFEPTKDAWVLEADASVGQKAAPLIEMTGGHLELIGARIRLSPLTLVPTMVHVKDADLTLTRAWLLGPHTPSADGFKSLITAENAQAGPTTVLLRDNVLVASKTLLHLHDHVQVKASNNLLLGLGDGILFEANRPTVPLQHVLDHNTMTARHSFFRLHTGPAFQAAGRALILTNSNAFLHPFAGIADKATLLRGADRWVASGCWNWRGSFNVYDARCPSYFAGNDKSLSIKQTRQDWQSVWGQAAEQEPLLLEAGPAIKLLTLEGVTPSALFLQLDRLALPVQLRGDRSQAPPGADLIELNILKKKG